MSAKIKIVIGVVILAVLIVLAIGLLSCGDDDADDTGTPATRDETSGGDDDKAGGSQPSMRTISTERSSGPHAIVANGAVIDAPKKLSLRVSAAPKQAVMGNWSVTCGRQGTSTDTFEVTPPAVIELRLPGKSPRSCAVGSSAQLTGSGRVKTVILSDR